MLIIVAHHGIRNPTSLYSPSLPQWVGMHMFGGTTTDTSLIITKSVDTAN